MQHLYDLIRPYWPTLLLFVGYPLVTAALNWWLWWDTPESWDAFALAHPRLATAVRILRALSPHLRKVAVVWRDLARARSAPGLLPTLDDLAHHRTTQPGPAPKPPGQQPGRATLGALLVLLVATAACPVVREGALVAARAPDPTDCRPGAGRCLETPDGPVPVICSHVATLAGEHREWPALPRDSRGGRQRTCLHGCAVNDAGVPHCVGLAADGGAR